MVKYRIVLVASILLICYSNGLSQIDTLQEYELENGTAYLLEESEVKRLILKNDTTSILILTETLNENNKKNYGSSLSGIYGVKSHKNLISVLKINGRAILYALYDISSGTKRIKNAYMFSSISANYELIDCYTVLEEYYNKPEQSKIIRFSEQGHKNEFNSSDKGRVPNTFYHNLMKFAK